MDEVILNLLANKETVFFALFLYLFYAQQQEKKEQTKFLNKQQNILNGLNISLEKLAFNQEKLTERIERIEVNIDVKSKLDEKDKK